MNDYSETTLRMCVMHNVGNENSTIIVMITTILVYCLKSIDLNDMWFQQDGAIRIDETMTILHKLNTALSFKLLRSN